MNKKLIFILCLMLCSVLRLDAQTSAVKSVLKKLYTIESKDNNGNLRHSVAIPVSSDEFLCLWTTLKTASSAAVTDMKGNKYDVISIVGADDIYDICKVRVQGVRADVLPLASSSIAKGASVWLSDGGKTSAAVQLRVGSVETFADTLSYYNIDGDAMQMQDGMAVIDDMGRIVGLTHLSGVPRAIHSADMRGVAAMSTTGLSANDRLAKSTSIPIDMPRDAEQAKVFLLMRSMQGESGQYSVYVDRFVELFPNLSEGYVARANQAVANKRYADADAAMQMAVRNCTDKAEAEYEWAKMIYNFVAYTTDSMQTTWTNGDAMRHVDEAIKLNNQPVYNHLKAKILYLDGDMSGALAMYESLENSDVRGSELYYEMGQCKMRLGQSDAEVLAMLDSAVAVAPRPLGTVSAPYILARGQMMDKMGDSRKALADYNLYDSLYMGNASADFYYLRHECEYKLRQYQPALNDLAHAVVLEPYNSVYIETLASQQLRLNQVDDAIRTSMLGLQRFPDNSVLHVIYGLALIHNDKKAEGIAELERAEQLGNTQATELIAKYK